MAAAVRGRVKHSQKGLAKNQTLYWECFSPTPSLTIFAPP